jgi:hypothetical protein
MPGPVPYRFQYRKKLWGNQYKLWRKKIFSPKSVTKLEDLTVQTYVSCTVYKYMYKKNIALNHICISYASVNPLSRYTYYSSAICCKFKNYKFYIAAHIRDCMGIGYRYISLVKKEWLYALEKANQNILNTVVETLLFFFLFMH